MKTIVGRINFGFSKPLHISEVKKQYDLSKVSIVTTPKLFPMVSGISVEKISDLKKRQFPIKRRMDNAIDRYYTAMKRVWDRANRKLNAVKNKIRVVKKMNLNNTTTVNRIAFIPSKYRKEFIEIADKYALNLALLDKIVLNSSLMVNARYDSRKNIMEFNPDYLKQHGMIRIGDAGEVISETDKTFIHEFGHCFWYNSLTEEDRRYFQTLFTFLQRDQLTGDMNQYIVGEKKRFDGSTQYSPYYTLRDEKFVSVYARYNFRENFAECFLYYKVAPKTLERICSKTYAFMVEKVDNKIEKDGLSKAFVDPDKIRQEINRILNDLQNDLGDIAEDHYRDAYDLGKEKAAFMEGIDADYNLTPDEKDQLKALYERNNGYLAGFMDDLRQEFDESLFVTTADGMVTDIREYADPSDLDVAFADVMDTQDHRLNLYAVNGLTLALTYGLQEASEELGGFWHTTMDDRSCEGCARLDGRWMLYSEFLQLYGNNECDGNCRCGELFEPAPIPDQVEALALGVEASGLRKENVTLGLPGGKKGLFKGGPGSGRYPKGSGRHEEGDEVVVSGGDDKGRVGVIRQRFEHMSHDPDMALYQVVFHPKNPEEAKDPHYVPSGGNFKGSDLSPNKKISKAGSEQNAYANSGVAGSTVRETANPALVEGMTRQGKIAAIDFHGTIMVNDQPNKAVVDKIRDMKATGWHIIIYTSGITENPGAINGIIDFMKRNEIPYDEVWQRQGKPDADVYFDDKAVNPNKEDVTLLEV